MARQRLEPVAASAVPPPRPKPRRAASSGPPRPREAGRRPPAPDARNRRSGPDDRRSDGRRLPPQTSPRRVAALPGGIPTSRLQWWTCRAPRARAPSPRSAQGSSAFQTLRSPARRCRRGSGSRQPLHDAIRFPLGRTAPRDSERLWGSAGTLAEPRTPRKHPGSEKAPRGWHGAIREDRSADPLVQLGPAATAQSAPRWPASPRRQTRPASTHSG